MIGFQKMIAAKMRFEPWFDLPPTTVRFPEFEDATW
jgi:hypothetical protein